MTLYLWDNNHKEIQHFNDVMLVCGDREGRLLVIFKDNKTKNVDFLDYITYSVVD